MQTCRNKCSCIPDIWHLTGHIRYLTYFIVNLYFIASKIITYIKMDLDPNWLKKRRTTTIICTAFSFVIGMEYSAISVSLLFYLQKLVPDVSGHEKQWYSVVMTACAFSSSIFGVVSGRYIDRTRKIKECLLGFTVVAMIGNLMYTVHQSVWFLVLGRFLCGMIDATQPVISGMCL